MAKKQKNQQKQRHKSDKALSTSSRSKKEADNKVLEFYASESANSHRQSLKSKISIWCFLAGGFVALSAVLYQRNSAETKYLFDHPFHQRQRNTTAPKIVSQKKAKTSLSELVRIACQKTRLVHCERGVLEVDEATRILRTKKALLKGHKILEIPRSVQTTTLDALRDPRVSALLEQSPKHPLSGALLRPKSYLRAYIAFELKRFPTADTKKQTPQERLHHAWLDYLPTNTDLESHPVARLAKEHDYNKQEHKNKNSNLRQLPPDSLMEYWVSNTLRSFLSEYHAFCKVSPDFCLHVSPQDWITACLLVHTRSFRSGPLNEADVGNDELDSYRYRLSCHDESGFSFDDDSTASDKASSNIHKDNFLFYDSCRKLSMRSCMVPLLDALDHQTTPNVGWSYMDDSSTVSQAKSFINYAQQDIAKKSQLVHSYGTISNSFLYARYGFVTSQGSGQKVALLAPYHRIIDQEIEVILSKDRTMELLPYLGFRDGYNDCHAPFDPKEAEIQQDFQNAKLEALKAMSNSLTFWTVTLPSPTQESDPLAANHYETALSMCRLLATTHRDYAGRATDFLRKVATSDQPENYRFSVSTDSNTSEGLEYRTWNVLEKLAHQMAKKVIFSLAKISTDSSGLEEISNNIRDHRLLIDEIKDAINELVEPPHHNQAWVLLGELETLTMLQERAQETQTILLNRKLNHNRNTAIHDEDYVVRQTQCPPIQ